MHFLKKFVIAAAVATGLAAPASATTVIDGVLDSTNLFDYGRTLTNVQVTSPDLVADTWFIPSAALRGEKSKKSQQPQSPSAIADLLEDVAHIDDPLLVGAGDCGSRVFTCSTSRTGSTSLLGQIFSVHFGGGTLLFVYHSVISNFGISLPKAPKLGLSNVRVFNRNNVSAVPLPGSLLLLLSAAGGLGGIGGLARRRQKNNSSVA